MAELLSDTFGRVVRDVRISLTDRCGLRCTYCMPAEGLEWIPRADLLTDGELLRLTGILADCGVQSARLTGGEPLLRPSAASIVKGLGEQGYDTALTTNGVQLARSSPFAGCWSQRSRHNARWSPPRRRSRACNPMSRQRKTPGRKETRAP